MLFKYRKISQVAQPMKLDIFHYGTNTEIEKKKTCLAFIQTNGLGSLVEEVDMVCGR